MGAIGIRQRLCHCPPSLCRRLLPLALERGHADALSYPEGEEDERAEAEKDDHEQITLDDGEQSVGGCDRIGVVWEVHNGDRVPRGGVEAAIVALADGASIDLACVVGELDREGFLVSASFLTVGGLFTDNDSLCCDALPEEGSVC